jgi:hypothetical protein
MTTQCETHFGPEIDDQVKKWLIGFDQKRYDDNLQGHNAPLLLHVEEVAGELENSGLEALAKLVRSGGFAIQQSKFDDPKYTLQLFCYSNFLDTALGERVPEDVSTSSLALTYHTLQFVLSSLIEDKLKMTGENGIQTESQ